MRLVRLEEPSTGAVELHPCITVLSARDRHRRDMIIRAVRALPAGGEPGAAGSIEVHGIIMDLDQPSLALLELHDTEIDPVLEPDDLPGHHRAEEPVAPADPEVGRARALVASADLALHELDEGVTRTEQLRDDLEQQRSVITTALQAASAATDSYAQAELTAAREALAATEARLRAVESTAAVNERQQIEARLDELISAADQSRREVRRLRDIDVDAVYQARVHLSEVSTPVTTVVPEAIDLADELEAIDQQLAVVRARVAGARQQLAELTARRDRAYDELQAAERSLRAPELDPAVVEDLERVHDEIFELDGRESRLGMGRARRRLAELREIEQQLLTRLGFDTWSSYIMGVTTADAEAERIRRHEVAKATYEFAEDELARAAAVPAGDAEELDAAEARREGALRKARELLGGEVPDPLAALRALRQPVSPTDAEASAAAADALRGAMVDAGAPLPAVELSLFELASWADRWLADAGELPSRIRTLEDQNRASEREIDALAARLEELDVASGAEALSPLPDDDPDLMAARRAVADCEQRVEAHQAASAELARLRDEDDRMVAKLAELDTELTRARAGREELAAELSAADEALAEAEHAAERRAAAESAERRDRQRREQAVAGLDTLEWYVLTRLAAQRSVSFVGSVPLVIDDAFADWPAELLHEVLVRLARMSDVVQMVLFTDDPGLTGWAAALGSERAAVLA